MTRQLMSRRTYERLKTTFIDEREVVPDRVLTPRELVQLVAKLSPRVGRVINVVCSEDRCRDAGVGSSWAIEWDGRIVGVTNWHVVDGHDKLAVHHCTEQEYDVTLLAGSPVRDVAIFAYPEDARFDDVFPFPIDSDGALPVGPHGLQVLAVGNPLALGDNQGLPGVSQGLISDLYDTSDKFISPGGHPSEYLGTTAAINPGNSGGPLVSYGGIVIGMNSAGFLGAEAMGLAVPLKYVLEVLELIDRDTTSVRVGDVTFVDTPHGIAMMFHKKSAQHSQFGIQPFDAKTGGPVNQNTAKVVAIDNEPVTTVKELAAQIDGKAKFKVQHCTGAFMYQGELGPRREFQLTQPK